MTQRKHYGQLGGNISIFMESYKLLISNNSIIFPAGVIVSAVALLEVSCEIIKVAEDFSLHLFSTHTVQCTSHRLCVSGKENIKRRFLTDSAL